MQYSFYHCIIQVLYITHNVCDISYAIFLKLRTQICGRCPNLPFDVTTWLVTTFFCCNLYLLWQLWIFGDNLMAFILVTVSAKLVTMLHRTNIRLLNWAVNTLHAVFVKFKEIFHLNCDVLWHYRFVTQTCDMPVNMSLLWHCDTNTVT